MKWSTALARFACVATATAVSLLGAEVALRRCHLVRINPWIAGFTGRANSSDGRGYYDYHCNRETFRSREFDDLPARGMRLVVLGDSNAWGSGVDDTERFGNLLADGLTSQGLPTAVWTLAWPGTTFRDFQLQFNRARNLAPDLVIIVGTAGNDVAETMYPPSTPRGWSPRPELGLLGSLRTLHVYHLLALASHRHESSEVRGSFGHGPCSISRQDPSGIAYTQALQQVCDLADVTRAEHAVTATLRDVQALATQIGNSGARYLFLEVPSRLRTPCADDDFTTAMLRARSLDLSESTRIETRFTDELASQVGASNRLDLLPLLASTCSTSYFPKDWHLSSQGHRVLASTLLPIVEQLAQNRQPT